MVAISTSLQVCMVPSHQRNALLSHCFALKCNQLISEKLGAAGLHLNLTFGRSLRSTLPEGLAGMIFSEGRSRRPNCTCVYVRVMMSVLSCTRSMGV